jgi:hypothetical protein
MRPGVPAAAVACPDGFARLGSVVAGAGVRLPRVVVCVGFGEGAALASAQAGWPVGSHPAPHSWRATQHCAQHTALAPLQDGALEVPRRSLQGCFGHGVRGASKAASDTG